MERREIHCSWCKKPKDQWNSRFLWRSARGRRYCSARCYAAAEPQVPIFFAVCTVPLLWLPISIFTAWLLSEMSTANLLALLSLNATMTIYTSFFIYMIAIGRAERRTRELENPSIQ
ncbi:MAG: hypothetical protein ACFFBM_11025 [Promethearchaeota archaeon]